MNLPAAVFSTLSNPLFELAPATLQARTFDLESKLSLSHELSFPILFTGLTFCSCGNLEKAKTLFKLAEIETFLEHNNDRVALTPLGFQEIISEKSLSFHAVAYISGFRANFHLNYNNTPDPIKLFWSFFTNVQVHGFGLNVSPNASSVIPLLNIAELFNKHKRAEDLHETNILLGLSLINARRFLQAAEVLRKSALFFQKKPGKAFKAAKIQLLIAEAIKQPSMINEKMQAYFKATELFLGKSLNSNAPLVISCNYDVYTALLRINPHLCKFLVKMLYEKLDPLKIAALRGLEFLMEYLGCSISSQLALILKTIILTYPLQPTHETEVFLPLSTPIQSQIPTVKSHEIPREMGPENQQTQKLLVDIYNHLLESFLNVLTSASSFLLRGLFIEIIAPNVFLSEMNGELRKFLFRIAEKITAICQGDLEINTSFVAALVQYLEGKVPQGGLLRLATQKLWESVKSKAIVNFPHAEARKLGDWVLESMQNIQENSKELSSIGVFIEIVRSLCARERKNSEIWGVCRKEMRNPLNNSSLLSLFEGFSGVLTLMIEDLLLMNANNMSVQANANMFGGSGTEKGQNPTNPALPQNTPSCFDTIKTFWQCLLEVLNCLETPLKYIVEVGFELLKKIGGIIAERAPSIHVLNSILMLFRTLEEFKQELPHEFLIDFFRLFCDCIPHSVYDESFMVFELLLRKLSDFLPSETDLIQKAINSLIDQFTVRSKAHKQAKSCLISVIKAQQSFETLFEAWSFTLFQNPEPINEQSPPGNIEDILESSLKSNSLLLSGSFKTKTLNRIPHSANNFDSKQFNRNHESFLERLNFAEKLFEDLSEEQFQILLQLLKTPSPVYTSIQKLVASGNAKVRLKGLKIVRKVLERFLKNRKNVSFFDLPACLLTKFVLVSVKTCWEKAFSDPKLHFNGLLILDQLFQTVLGTPDVKFELNRVFTRREDLLKPNYTVIDIFNYEFLDDFKLSFEDDRYLHLRLFQILRLMPSISGLMNSSWSNIRSLAYGLVCYWVKSDVSFYKPSLMKNLLHSVFGILLGLLTSKESECRTGGLNILGSFCGFGFDFQKIEVPEILRFFRRFENIISQAIWESVFEIQNDWDGTNQAAAATLIQLAGPKELIVGLFRLKKEFSVLEYNNTLNNTNNNQGNQGGLMQNMGGSEEKKNFESVSVNGPEIGENINSSLDEGSLFWMERLGNEELQELIAMFRNEYKPPQNLWIERANYNEDDIEEDYDRFIYEADEVGNFFFEENNAQNGQKVYADDFEEHPDNNLEDLGIIEVKFFFFFLYKIFFFLQKFKFF